MAKDNLEERLRTHVSRLAGDIGERNVFRPLALEAASSYLERQWREQGYAIGTLAYEVSSIRCANLEVTRRGGVRKGEILLIGAHYDSVMGSPGANDNASGIAALLEISRMFTGIDPTMTVRFIAFVNEEPPFFRSVQQGSMVYAAAARRRKDDIRLMASLETIGWYSDEPGSQSYPPLFGLFYPARANFLGIVSDFRSRTAMQQLAAAFRAHSHFPLETAATFRFIPGVSWSDHRSGHSVLSLSTLSSQYRYAQQAQLSGACSGNAWPSFCVCCACSTRYLTFPPGTTDPDYVAGHVILPCPAAGLPPDP